MKPIRITPKADDDVNQCFAWIHRQNPEAGRRFLAALERTYADVSQMPGLGSRRYASVTFLKDVRMVKIKGFEKYLLFYIEREASVDIIRILHSARHIPEALQEE